MEHKVKDFKAMKEASKYKRRKNKEFSTNLLVEKGISFSSHNNGFHLVLSCDNSNGLIYNYYTNIFKETESIVIIDFWPSTGLYKVRHTPIKGRGIYNLLKLIGVN